MCRQLFIALSLLTVVCSRSVARSATRAGDRRHRTSLRRSFAVGALVATLALLGTVSSASAVPSITAFTYDSQPGDLLTNGASYWYAPPGSDVQVTGYGDGVNVDANQSSWMALIVPPTGQLSLTPNTTYQTTWPATASTAGMEVGGLGVGCTDPTGEVTIHEYQTDVLGNITQFSASYRQLCNPAPDAQPGYGEIRYNSALGYAAATVDRPTIVYPDSVLVTTQSEPETATITNHGTGSLTLGQASFTGVNPSDFAVANDTCAGHTLAPGAACTVDVIFTPTDVNARRATLHYDDTTPVGGRNIQVSGEGYKLAGSVGLTTSAAIITYGGKVRVTAHLGTASGNRTLAIYRHPVGGDEALAGSGPVDANGNFSLLLAPARTTTYTARWSGDATHAQAVKAATVKVRLVMHAQAVGAYTVSSGYHLYHLTSSCYTSHTGCPRFSTWASPAHPRYAFAFHLQVHTASGWKTVTSGTGHLNSRGTQLLLLIYKGTAIRGHAYRINFAMASHADHLGDVTNWIQFKVV